MYMYTYIWKEKEKKYNTEYPLGCLLVLTILLNKVNS
jgi:hypothetical protein